MILGDSGYYTVIRMIRKKVRWIMKNRVVPVLITLVLIVIVGAATVVSLISAYRKGSTEFVDFETDL